jgi:phosphohistidine phosphatase
MRVFLIRHARAAAGEPDELRPLTHDGCAEARALGRRLAAHPAPPALVLSSPLLRARQTAEAIARATGAELRVDERLSPGADAEALLALLEGAGAPVAAVAHQPDCSEIAIALTGGPDPGFPPAGVLELELEP